MCLQHTAVRPHQKWHWAGDEIVSNPIIPASRKVPDTRLTGFDIDIRSFLSNEHDAVIKKFLDENIHRLPPDQQGYFSGTRRGSFDKRSWFVKKFMVNLHYTRTKRKFDSWLFPEETLAQRGGDCEDLSIFLAVLLEASGISQYCIRVALGSVVDYTSQERPESFHHAWVMYQNENGAWEIFDPAGMVKTKEQGKKKLFSGGNVEYIPHFVFNRSHLWRIRSSEAMAGVPLLQYLNSRSFWKNFQPSFAMGVHNSIFDEALKGMSWFDLASVKAESLTMDVNTLAYDPREHFDFAYIDEGWKTVEARLKTGSIADFARAAHAIGDFYAHTLYGHFADKKTDGSLKIYDPSLRVDPSRLTYDFAPFAPLPGCTMKSVSEASQYWKGKLISGQWWRWYTTFPSDLKKRSDFPPHRCLPDHDLVSVDSSSKPSTHKLYSPAEYAVQFKLRKAAAIEHIAAAYKTWKGKR